AGTGGGAGTTGRGGTAGTGGASGRGGTTGSAGTMGAAGTTGSAGTTGGAGGGTGGTGGIGQVVMSIDFIGGRPPMGGAAGTMVVAAPMMAATELAGVKPAAHWNGAANIMGTLTNLLVAD